MWPSLENLLLTLHTFSKVEDRFLTSQMYFQHMLMGLCKKFTAMEQTVMQTKEPHED